MAVYISTSEHDPQGKVQLGAYHISGGEGAEGGGGSKFRVHFDKNQALISKTRIHRPTVPPSVRSRRSIGALPPQRRPRVYGRTIGPRGGGHRDGG